MSKILLHHTYRSSVQQSTPIWLSAPMVDILWRPAPLFSQKVFTPPPNVEAQPPSSNTAPYLPVTTRTVQYDMVQYHVTQYSTSLH